MNKMFALLVLAFSVSVSADVVIDAPNPASTFLQAAVTKLDGVLAGKGDAASKANAMCAIFKDTVSSGYIGGIWLGNYRTLASDQAGVKAFVAMVPSLVMTKAMPNISGATAGSIVVSPQATERKPGLWAVAIKATTGGKTYNATAIVREVNGTMRLIDGEYLGFSGVNYFKNDYKKLFDDASRTNSSTPVSQVVHDLMSDKDYVNCP
jgi:ABC-type transporter MlaC component